MTGFSRSPLALLICCLFSGLPLAHAAPADDLAAPGASTAAANAADSDAPLRLRKERRFNILAKKKAAPSEAKPLIGIEAPVLLNKDDSYPLFIIADQVSGRTEDLAEAEGHVELRKVGSLVFADRLTYRPLEDELEANGAVRLLQDGAEFDTPHLKMKLEAQLGSAENVNYKIVREVPSLVYPPQAVIPTAAGSNAINSNAPMMLNVANSYGLPTQSPGSRVSEAYGEAERLDFEGENQFSFFSNTFSTCKPGDTDWYLQSSKMHLDYDNKAGTATHSTLWFGGVPILYTPLAMFPLGGQNQSGILHPHFSMSTLRGLDLSLPYFWSIAPDYDMTFYPRYMSKRGWQLGLEARYLEPNFRGTTRLEYMPNDEGLNRSRYAYRVEHLHNLGRGVSALVNWNGVSDDFYLQDLTSRLLQSAQGMLTGQGWQTSQTQLPQQLQLNYSPSPWLQSNLQVLRYQTLQFDTVNPVARPYFLEPQLNLVGYKPNVLNTDLSMIGQFSRFTHFDPAKAQGDRLVFYPQVSLPIVHPAFQITPKVGLHMSQYALDRQAAGLSDNINRVLPTFSIDSTMVFEREGNWLGRDYIQTLEPRLYYVNIPYKDQSNIPLFDTGLSDFNFAQIFSENRYSGYDRINDANQLTAAVTTRLLDGATGVERFKAMLGQRYYFKPQRVAIAGETSRQADFSNVVAAVNGLVAPKTYGELAWEYNYRENVSERYSAGVRFQPDYGKALSASYRYTRDPLTSAATVDQIDVAGQWPLAGGWYAVGRYNYSLKDSRALETIAGIEYNAACWAVRVVGQHLTSVAGSSNDTIFLQLEFNDFGSIGTNPMSLLRRSIPGFGKVNELPDNSGSTFSNF